jgi:hypothetical protein
MRKWKVNKKFGPVAQGNLENCMDILKYIERAKVILIHGSFTDQSGQLEFNSIDEWLTSVEERGLDR